MPDSGYYSGPGDVADFLVDVLGISPAEAVRLVS